MSSQANAGENRKSVKRKWSAFERPCEQSDSHCASQTRRTAQLSTQTALSEQSSAETSPVQLSNQTAGQPIGGQRSASKTKASERQSHQTSHQSHQASQNNQSSQTNQSNRINQNDLLVYYPNELQIGQNRPATSDRRPSDSINPTHSDNLIGNQVEHPENDRIGSKRTPPRSSHGGRPPIQSFQNVQNVQSIQGVQSVQNIQSDPNASLSNATANYPGISAQASIADRRTASSSSTHRRPYLSQIEEYETKSANQFPSQSVNAPSMQSSNQIANHLRPNRTLDDRSFGSTFKSASPFALPELQVRQSNEMRITDCLITPTGDLGSELVGDLAVDHPELHGATNFFATNSSNVCAANSGSNSSLVSADFNCGGLCAKMLNAALPSTNSRHTSIETSRTTAETSNKLDESQVTASRPNTGKEQPMHATNQSEACNSTAFDNRPAGDRASYSSDLLCKRLKSSEVASAKQTPARFNRPADNSSDSNRSARNATQDVRLSGAASEAGTSQSVSSLGGSLESVASQNMTSQSLVSQSLVSQSVESAPSASNQNHLTQCTQSRQTLEQSGQRRSSNLNCQSTHSEQFVRSSAQSTHCSNASVCSTQSAGSSEARASTVGRLHRKLEPVQAFLEMRSLWNEFNALGTEMIVTKAGR